MIQKIKLDQETKNAVLGVPETGMGYHFLEIKDSDQSDLSIEDKEAFIISNSEAIYLSSRSSPIVSSWKEQDLDIEELENDHKIDLFQALQGTSTNYRQYHKFSDAESALRASLTKQSNVPSYAYVTRQGDEFRRLSAFRNDNRVLSDGRLRPGSYGTTILDLESATSGVAAVGRYALPNRLAACYVFQIIPPPGTKVLFGTVTPNFGLCGGGVEVYFPNGCEQGSVKLMGTIPEF